MLESPHFLNVANRKCSIICDDTQEVGLQLWLNDRYTRTRQQLRNNDTAVRFMGWGHWNSKTACQLPRIATLSIPLRTNNEVLWVDFSSYRQQLCTMEWIGTKQTKKGAQSVPLNNKASLALFNKNIRAWQHYDNIFRAIIFSWKSLTRSLSTHEGMCSNVNLKYLELSHNEVQKGQDACIHNVLNREM